MNSPRWKKLLRDLQSAQGRMAMMVIAIAVSIFSVGTFLSAYTIARREMSRNYLGTNPASAFIELDRVDDALVKAVSEREGISEAEATSWVGGRAEIGPNEWMPVLLFVVPDFETSHVSTVAPDAGAYPPTEQTILVEREVLPMLDLNIGDAITIQTPNGTKQQIKISGTVHDPALAPAWQEQTVYGYITPATLAMLGEGETLNILKVIVSDEPYNLTAIESTVSELAVWLKARGYVVHEIRIPPPGRHPHQSQMTSVITLFLVFSFMALLLSAILSATMINGLLAQQIRQIGIMKAIGARTRQITGLYLVLIVLLGIAASLIGVPLGIAAGRGFTGVIAQLLNLEIYSDVVPSWVYLVLILMGILIPLLVALDPILKATRITVRETLNDYGISRDASASSLRDGWLSRIRFFDNTLILALRNTFRRRGRLILTLSLLSAAGAMFMTGINVRSGWQAALDQSAADRNYDLEIRFNSPVPTEQVDSLLANVPGVEKSEAWSLTPAALNRPDALEIVRTYPDGGHGSFTLRSIPLGSDLIATPLLDGRFLQAGDTDAVVLNQNARAFFPEINVGDEIELLIEGEVKTFRLVGVIQQTLSPSSAYVLPETFASATNQPVELTNAVRVVMREHDKESSASITRDIEQALAVGNVSVKVAVSEALLGEAISGHVYIFIVALMMISTVMAVVGGLGLMSSMGTSVIERTREFGVMRAIGAKSKTILRNIISEGVFIGMMSWLIALPLSIPLSLGIGYLIGMMSFRSPLPLIVSPMGLVIWLSVIVVGSIAASAYPAQQASRLTVRETLAYV
ncbi:MAG: FtsX-like permease family protein [Anaerolineales bacterium]|nr:FtsX-like permease family protein [Anaerolineales bacterium]